jgi:hypothetical protein
VHVHKRCAGRVATLRIADSPAITLNEQVRHRRTPSPQPLLTGCQFRAVSAQECRRQPPGAERPGTARVCYPAAGCGLIGIVRSGMASRLGLDAGANGTGLSTCVFDVGTVCRAPVPPEPVAVPLGGSPAGRLGTLRTSVIAVSARSSGSGIPPHFRRSLPTRDRPPASLAAVVFEHVAGNSVPPVDTHHCDPSLVGVA